MTTIRQQRVATLLFQELSILIGGELQDPQLSLITVTDVKISRDLRNAKVYVYRHDDDRSQQEILDGLQKATPFLRTQVAQRCGLRVAPELAFYYDETPAKAARIDQLLEQIAQERSERNAESAQAAETENAALDPPKGAAE